MAPWTALNIEPESDVEDVEYDNTKEIQIEEALKLYQVALKLHSQGPNYYEEAEKAYDSLFESEIFQYPESKSELHRLVALSANDDFEDEGIVLTSEVAGEQDLGPGTLPQILYLSFKNRGQFLLDRLVHQLRTDNPDLDTTLKASKYAITTALGLLSDALDKDSSDSGLWRRIAKLSEYIGSRRIARFALESSIIDEDREESSFLDGFDLEDLAVKHDLEQILQGIDYESSQLLPSSHQPLAKSLADRFDFLSILSGNQPDTISSALPPNDAKTLLVPSKTWDSIAEAILEAHELNIDEHKDMSNVYVLQLVDAGEETAEALKSPSLVTSESLSKRRFSRGPMTPFKPLPQNFANRHTISPTLRTKNLDSVLLESQNDSGTRNNDVFIESNDTIANSVPLTEPRNTNKRNSMSAGLQDTPDGGGRSRSKRLRARAETMADDAPDPNVINKQHEEQLGVYSRADDWVFSVAYEIGCRFGCKWIGNAETVREATAAGAESSTEHSTISDPNSAPLRDLRQILGTWNTNRSNLLLNGTGIGASAVLIDDGSDSGFASFMERSKTDSRRLGKPLPDLIDQGISQWFQSMKRDSYDLEYIALLWLRALLEPRKSGRSQLRSMYTQYVWSTELKDYLAEILIEFDEVIHAFVQHGEALIPHKVNASSIEIAASIGFAQTIFELHVDVYSKMVAPDSKTDQPSRVVQRDRMSRWASLANNVVSSLSEECDGKYSNAFVLRHLWAQVAYIGLVEASARDHILICYQDLRRMFEVQGSPSFILPNNSVMPEVSLEALEQELSKEKTMDFFQGIFGTESKDPVTLIEKLEPVLMKTFNSNQESSAEGNRAAVHDKDPEKEVKSSRDGSPVPSPSKTDESNSENSQLVDFLQKATIQLKLSLWHQLKGAYNRIDYPGMKVVCNFRSMILILRELHGSSYASETPEDRAGNLIIWIRNLADLTSQTLDTIKSYAKGLDCLAEENLDLALEACAFVTRLFHVFALWEDSLRIGQNALPSTPGSTNTYKNAMTVLRETQSKTWHLLYLIYREAFSQDSSLSEFASDDLIEFIRAIHCSFGNREYCRVGRKNLMKMLKSELIRLNGPDEEIAQALYDLYGLKITTNPNSIWEHGCAPDSIDRTSTLEIIEYVMSQATSMNMKDLLKSDVRVASEKMQAVIGIPRAGASTTQQSFNRRLVTNYLKSPITSNHLMRALQGLEGLSTMTIKTEYAAVASKKWFFLIGWIHLAKYRNVKRVGPDNSDDLDHAITFLKLDLDFDASGWETWMRLGQAYDSKLDEEVLWDANMINDKPDELTQYERHAIHCYEMAVSLVQQSADETRETQLKVAELYADFANRLYSSTREPFSGRVFDLTGHVRYINQQEKGTYQVPAFESLSLTTIWKICERLYQKALDEKLEDDWYIWYMRGKCRWKLLHSAGERQLSWTHPLEAFIKAVEQVPEKRDSRHPEKEPVLEPHFKLLSIVHKLLKLGAISPEKGIEILQHSQYTKKLQIDDPSDWKSYISELLQVLRNADKSNWHHRMIVKGAYLVFEEQSNQQAAAQAAKDKFSQQILTKAMAIQIWKPEYERPGRQFVYASRYLRFIIKLLEQLGERPSLETLGKRVRKKQNEYIDAVDIFDEICEAHMRLIRIQGSIPEKSEERVFHQGMAFEHFVLNAERLETWAHSQLSLTNIKLPLLSEVWELKKLSGTLLEKGPFEELMMDIYACLFENVVPELIARAGEAQNREKMRIDRMLMDTDTNQSAQASATEATTAPSRPKQISKTEVRRRSEALVTKTPLLSVKAKAVITRDASPDLKSKPKVPIRRPSNIRNPTPDPVAMNDSADAESELSSVADSDMEDPSPKVVKNQDIRTQANNVADKDVGSPSKESKSEEK